MTPELRFSGAVSAVLHGALLLALLLTLEPAAAPPLDSAAVTMEFALEPAQVQRAQSPAATPAPAPAPAEVPTPDQPSPTKPRPTPIEAPPPLPPPPPPPPPAPLALPVPPPPPAPPAPPTPTQAIQAPLLATPAPPQASEPPLPLPPIPPPPAPAPPAPRPVPQAAPPAPKPDTRPPAPHPAPERPNPAARTQSTSNQPNPTRNTAPDSQAAEATLSHTMSRLRQTQAPTHPYNPPVGAGGGGDPKGVESAKLSPVQAGAIGDRIRECWTRDAGALDEGMSALLKVTTDGGGTIHVVDILRAPPGPVGRAFVDRARRAALSPQCNPIPLPKRMLGQNQSFEITFKP